MGKTLKSLTTFKNNAVTELAKKLIDKWKKLIKQSPKEKPSSPKGNNGKSAQQESSSITIIDKSIAGYRNNVKTMIFEALIDNIPADQHQKAKEIVIALEMKMYELLKEGVKYFNRGKALASNILDVKNKDFKLSILNGKLTPHRLVTMDVKEMLNQDLKTERAQTEKAMFESLRSDWQDEHAQVAEGMYTCESCKGKRTTSKEIQMRSADEPMTLFIRCVDCGNEWRIG